MEIVKKSLSWIVGVFFLILGMLAVWQSLHAGLCLIAISLVILPPVNDFMRQKLNLQMKQKHKYYAIATLFFATFVFINSEENIKQHEAMKEKERLSLEAEKSQRESIKNEFFSNKIAIMRQINYDYVNKNYQSVISQSTKFLPSEDAGLLDIHKKAKEALAIIQKEEKTDEILNKLKTLPADQIIENRNLYQQLVNMNPQNEKYREKLSLYSNKVKQSEQSTQSKQESYPDGTWKLPEGSVICTSADLYSTQLKLVTAGETSLIDGCGLSKKNYKIIILDHNTFSASKILIVENKLTVWTDATFLEDGKP